MCSGYGSETTCAFKEMPPRVFTGGEMWCCAPKRTPAADGLIIIKPNGWNLLRIAVEGKRIRVWLNAMHDDPGLRIDYKDDSRDAVAAGAVGVRAHDVAAWFDDVVVLPIGELPKPAKVKTSPGKQLPPRAALPVARRVCLQPQAD